MKSYVYLVTNLINQKCYIGKTNNPNTRWSQHKSKSKTNNSNYFLRALTKYGVNNFRFEIIKTCESQEKAYEYERVLISLFSLRNKNFGYNISEGGRGSKGFKVKDSVKAYFKEKYIGSKSIKARFSDDEIISILKDYSTGSFTTYDLAKKYNCGKSTMIRIVNGTAYSNIIFDRSNFHQISKKHKLNNSLKGEKSKSSKLSNEDVFKIRELYTTGNYNYQMIADKFNVTKQNIYYIIKNKTRKNNV